MSPASRGLAITAAELPLGSRPPSRPGDDRLADDAAAWLDDHWALGSLSRPRRAAILASATARLQGARPPDDVSEAELLHLAGACDLAGRDALTLLAAVRQAGGDAPAPVLVARRTVVARRAFLLHAALATDVLPGRVGATDDDERGALHRLLQLAALAELADRRGAWQRWLERHTPALSQRPVLAPVFHPAAPAPTGAARDDWELRYRSVVVAAWVLLLRRDGPSGLDDAMELLARLREERASTEAPWLAAIASAHGQAGATRARFALFSLAHLADAAVELLLWLRHGEAYTEAADVSTSVALHLELAGEAAAGDRAWSGALAWLCEAARLVIARRTPQLELSMVR